MQREQNETAKKSGTMDGDSEMPNQVTTAKAPESETTKSSQTEEERILDRDAEEAAESAGKAEQHYDESHDLFTK
jgi:hypothetical protein